MENIQNINETKKENKAKKQKSKKILWLVVMYILALGIIGLGFIFGNGYCIIDTKYPSIHMDQYLKELYGADNLNEMFDGWIEKYEGWYGLSWKSTYSFYQKADVTEEQFEEWVKYVYEYPEGYLEWSEKEYVDFISDISIYKFSDYEYVWMRLNNDIVLIEFEPTNVEEDYEKRIPAIITLCVAIFLIPIIIFIIMVVIEKKKR